MKRKFFSWIVAHPRTVILLNVLLVLLLGISVLRIQIVTTIESLLDESDPTLIELRQFHKNFGSDQTIFLVFSSDRLFNKSVLNFIDNLENSISKFDFVKNVITLRNFQTFVDENNTLTSKKLIEHIPQSVAERRAAKKKVLNEPFVLKNLISKDLKTTAVIVRLKSDIEMGTFKPDDSGAVFFDELEEDLKAQLKKQSLKPEAGPMKTSHQIRAVYELENLINKKRPDFEGLGIKEIYLAGGQVPQVEMIKAIRQDNRIFIPLTLSLLILYLYFTFRNWQGILLPLFVLVSSVISTMGFMSLIGWNLNVITTLIPTVLFVISVADTIHILVRYYEELGREEDQRTALITAMCDIFPPCFLTSITTMIGFLGLLNSRIVPSQQLGILVAFGVALALWYSVTLIPAVLILSQKPSARNIELINGHWMQVVLQKTVAFNRKYKYQIVTATFLIMAVSIYSIRYLNIETTFHKLFPAEHKLNQGLNLVDGRLGGSVVMEITLEAKCSAMETIAEHHRHLKHGTKTSEGEYKFKDIENLQQIENLQKYLMQDPRILHSHSLVDIVKYMRSKIKVDNSSKDFQLPLTSAEAANYIFLWELAADPQRKSSVVNEDYSIARISIRHKTIGSNGSADIVKKTEQYIQKNINPELHVVVTGATKLYFKVANDLFLDRSISFSVSTVLIILVMTVVFRSLTIGLLSIIPNVFPILLNFLIMIAVGIDFNNTTSMIALIGIGLVVDDTIHFFSRYIKEYRRNKDPEAAIEKTIFSAGRAMAYTSFILSTGFLVTLFSSFKTTQHFGLLTGMLILVALVADLVLVASIILLFKPKIRT